MKSTRSVALIVLASAALCWAAAHRFAIAPRRSAIAAQRTHAARVEQQVDKGEHGARSPRSAKASTLPAGTDLGTVMQRAHFAFRSEGVALTSAQSTYAVTAERGVVSLTPSSSVGCDARWHLETETARASRSVATLPRRRAAHRRARGIVDRARRCRRDVDQHARRQRTGMALRGAPDGNGDLIVAVVRRDSHTPARRRMACTSPTTRPRLSLRTCDVGRCRRRACRDRCALRARRDRDTRAGGGRGRRGYPVVLDPLVAPEFGIDQPLVAAAPAIRWVRPWRLTARTTS